jgi:hypothetical protein
MRYQEITESSLDVIRTARNLAHQYGVNVDLAADGPQAIDLTWIERTTGQKGSGGKFLADLMRLSDENGTRIMLTVLHGEPKLIELYKKFGFYMYDEGEDGEEPVMVRDPRVPACS